MDIQKLRKAEYIKYEKAYALSEYHISQDRFMDVVDDLKYVSMRGSFLDVSCGCGEIMEQARRMGFHPVKGTEIVKRLLNENVILAEAHALPFANQSFNVVTMLDVIEHLIPGDDKLACQELARIAKYHIFITANNLDSKHAIGEELHINKRSYKEWDMLFRSWFPGIVTWLKRERRHVSQGWRIDL